MAFLDLLRYLEQIYEGLRNTERKVPTWQTPGIRETGSTRAADNRTDKESELIELRRENRRLRMEVDVLKQAALIFARR